MIDNFKDKITEDIYNGINSKKTRKIPLHLHDKIRRILDQLNAAITIDDMRIPPSNMLESLSGNLSDFWSVRINKQRRIVFIWHEEKCNAQDIYIDDYHK